MTKLVEDGVPVQAYIPRNVYRRFKRLYEGQHGAISRLIRAAFLMAIEEDETTEELAEQQADRHLPPATDGENATLMRDREGWPDRGGDEQC